jgi:hypothetical protein
LRRGLISWSRDEVPASVLDRRVARLQEQMRSSGLGAVLVYTSFARPSAVAWLTHFVPYWNEGLLVVLPQGAPVLLAAFSRRMHDWIRSVSHVGEVQSVPQLGRAAADLIEGLPAAARVGVVELDALPWTVAEPLSSSGARLVDASALFASIRQPADDVEVRLARRAAQIALDALASIPRGARRASEVLSAIEASARLNGAEEVLPRLAPDLGAGAALLRFEGDCALGERYAVQLSLAYKSAWIRMTRSFSKGAPPRSWLQAQAWSSNWAELASETGAVAAPAPGDVAFRSVEACLGSAPFSLVALGVSGRAPVPVGTLASLSLRLDLPDGPWLGGGPGMIGSGALA